MLTLWKAQTKRQVLHRYIKIYQLTNHFPCEHQKARLISLHCKPFYRASLFVSHPRRSIQDKLPSLLRLKASDSDYSFSQGESSQCLEANRGFLSCHICSRTQRHPIMLYWAAVWVAKTWSSIYQKANAKRKKKRKIGAGGQGRGHSQ